MLRQCLSIALAVLMPTATRSTSTAFGGARLRGEHLVVDLELRVVDEAHAVHAPVALNPRPVAIPLLHRAANGATDGLVVVRQTCAPPPRLRQHLAVEA